MGETNFNSILITGTDYTGKTTLINNIKDFLNKSKKDIKINKGPLIKNSIFKKAEELMKYENQDKLTINSLLAMSFFIDTKEYSLKKNEILIQDSYIFRTMAFCEAYGVPHISEMLDKFLCDSFLFDCVILLSANNEAKLKRSREKKDALDEDILNNLELSNKMDESIEIHARKSKNFIHINTTNKNEKEVFNEAIKFILEGK